MPPAAQAALLQPPGAPAPRRERASPPRALQRASQLLRAMRQPTASNVFLSLHCRSAFGVKTNHCTVEPKKPQTNLKLGNCTQDVLGSCPKIFFIPIQTQPKERPPPGPGSPPRIKASRWRGCRDNWGTERVSCSGGGLRVSLRPQGFAITEHTLWYGTRAAINRIRFFPPPPRWCERMGLGSHPYSAL